LPADFLEKPYRSCLARSIEVAFARENQYNRDHDIADAIPANCRSQSARHRARMMERLGMRQLTEVMRLGVMARQLPTDRQKARPRFD
jgi:two-component system, LuxR family, response regulator FixJ